MGKTVHVLGPEIEQGQAPQLVVPAGQWQMARSLGDYTLVGCTVAPGFEFSGSKWRRTVSIPEVIFPMVSAY